MVLVSQYGELSITNDSNKLPYYQKHLRISGHDPVKYNLALTDEELCTALTAYEHIHSI